MNKWYFAFGSALLLSAAGVLQAQETVPQSGTKIIIIEEKVDRAGNKTVTKTIREGNFTDAEIDAIIAEETKNGNTAQVATPQDERGYLGVMIENAEGGVRVTEVVEGSPAAAAGLKAGDVIMAVDQSETANMESLVSAVSNHKPGETVQVHYLRDGASATASAVLAVREEPVISDAFKWDEHIQGMKEHEKEMQKHDEAMQKHDEMMKEHEAKMKAEHKKAKPRFGVTIDNTEDASGVLVTSVYEGSIADEIGIQEGDVITSFNGIEVHSTGEFIEAVRTAPAEEKVKVLFTRDGKKQKEKLTFERT